MMDSSVGAWADFQDGLAPSLSNSDLLLTFALLILILASEQQANSTVTSVILNLLSCFFFFLSCMCLVEDDGPMYI